MNKEISVVLADDSEDFVKSVKNYYDSRPTSADVMFGDGRLRQFKASSSMTTGKPTIGDSHIIHLPWDANDGFDAQIAVGVRTPVLPTEISISLKMVAFSSGGYL